MIKVVNVLANNSVYKTVRGFFVMKGKISFVYLKKNYL